MLGYFKIKKDIIDVLCYAYSYNCPISEKKFEATSVQSQF